MKTSLPQFTGGLMPLAEKARARRQVLDLILASGKDLEEIAFGFGGVAKRHIPVSRQVEN